MMRLLAILLNRLGSNYHSLANGTRESDLFSVQIARDGPKITKPADLIKALIDTGHSVEVVPSSRLTTFGVSLCLKEPDNSWTNVPLGVFLESGFEDREGNMAPAMMPHSGLDMYVSGPLAGSRADGTPSQFHFIGIEGFCGWKSHENPVVPFSEAVESVERLSGEDAVRAARIAGLYANVLNGLATDLQLPLGGYGLTSVCNDSAAPIQQCLYGVNSIYPMTSIGKFMHRTLRYAQNLREKISSMDDLEEERMELCHSIQSMKELPNDIDSAPSNSESAARRMLKTIQPRLPFALNKDTKKIAESLLEEEECEKKAYKDRGTVIKGPTVVPAAS